MASTTKTTITPWRSRTRTIGLWTLQIVVALIFFGAGGSKLLGVQPMVDIFTAIGVGQWFRYLTGTIEVLGAALLVSSTAAFWGALLLACTMVGAIFTHLVLIGGNPLPAIVLLVLTATLAWLRRPGRGT